MKAKTILSTAALGLALLTAAHADVTIEVTGASAFRKAALTAIRAALADGGNYKFAHDKSSGNLTSSTRAIFQGTITGVAGTTTIRTCFTGSVEGIRALAIGTDTYNEQYISPTETSFAAASLASGGTEVPGIVSKEGTKSEAEFAFSDVAKESTPLSSYTLPGERVGVVAFTMITNEGAPANLTNVTGKQFQALFGAGKVPAYVFTGNASDTTYVYAMGRNDGSGTRTTYMAETGMGITTPVQQYVTTGNYSVATGNGSISKIYLVPSGGNKTAILGSSATDASTVWSNNIAGNGGYNSGSSLVTHLGYTTSNTEVFEYDADLDDGTLTTLRAAGPIALVSFLSVADAVTARGGGARFLAYNGVKLDDIATSGDTLSPADKDKIRTGAYTAWSWQNLYKRTAFAGSSDEGKVYTQFISKLPAAISSTGVGLTTAEMNLSSRTTDGGVVRP